MIPGLRTGQHWPVHSGAQQLSLRGTAWRRQREKRQEQAKLRAVKTLGEAAADVDDLGAWVTKSRALEEARKAAERAKADKAARLLALQVRLHLSGVPVIPLDVPQRLFQQSNFQ